MKKYLLSILAVAFSFTISARVINTTIDTKHLVTENQDLVKNTSTPFLASAQILMKQSTYNQVVKEDWSYYPILKTIYNFQTERERLPDLWYNGMASIISMPNTKIKIDQLMNPKGVIIAFQYTNVFGLNLTNITSQ